MPLVKMPDGTVVNMPDKLTPEQGARLKAQLEMQSQAHERRAKDLAKPPESPTSAKNLAGAAVEPMMAMGSGALAAPVSGLAGIGAGITNKLGITNTPAADVVNKVGSAMTYEPRTTGGQNAMRAFGAIPQALHEGAEWTGNKTLSATGSPMAATVVQTALEGIPRVLGAKLAAKAAETPGILRPKPADSALKALANKGVVTTPGQRGGPGSWRNAAEQKLTSLPVGGQSIAARRAESVKRWSSEKLEESLKDAGATPIPANKTGRDAYLHAYTQLSGKYDALLPKMRGSLDSAAQGAPSLRADLQKIRAQVSAKGNGMQPVDSQLVSRVIDDTIGRFPARGQVKGNVLSEINETLRTEAGDLRKGNVSERKAAKALDAVNDSFHKMLSRDNPQFAAEKTQLDKAYSKFQQALLASRIGGKGQGGAFTPNQYLRAIERRDTSKNKRAYGTGTAHGQPEAESASKILGNDYPDSGTAGRAELIEMLKNPWGSASGVASSVVTPALYSRPIQRALQNRALKGGNRPATGTGAVLGAGAAVSPEQQKVLRQAGAVP